MVQLPSDDERFRSLFDSYALAVERYCLRRLPQDAAVDAAADVMLVAWRRISDVPDGEASKLWLYGVARRVVAEAQRSRRRRGRLVAKVGGTVQRSEEGPEVQVVQRAEDQELLEAMGRLKDMDREILQLRIWEELARSEVASLLSISEAGVDKRFGRALKRLRRSLEAGAKRRSHRNERQEVSYGE